MSKGRDVNDVARDEGPEGLAKALENAEAEAPDLKAEALAAQLPQRYEIDDLLNYNIEEDPNCLLGKRWLCRTQAALLAGPTGVGKSSLGVQAMICWTLGEPFFGIRPVKPLTTCLIQAENDKGDMSEELQGVLKNLGLLDRVEELKQRMHIYREDCATGQEFIRKLEAIAQKHLPDLVILDNLSTYFGGEENSNSEVSSFLRNQLNPVCNKYGFAVLVVDHHGKPSADPKAVRNGRSKQYNARGASSKADWARAILDLREFEHPVYSLSAYKRGNRAGLTASDLADAEQVCEIHIRHSENGICWERDSSMIQQLLDEEEGLVQMIKEKMGVGLHRASGVIEFAIQVTGKKRSTVYRRGSPENKAYRRVLKETKSSVMRGFYQVRNPDVQVQDKSNSSQWN